LDTSEFKRVLDIGLGRTILFLDTNDSGPHRDAILYACLHNTSYDRQCEGSRSEYILDVIAHTNDFAFYRNEILDALGKLSDEVDDYDAEQLYELAVELARRSDKQARQVLYDKFDANPALADFAGAHSIIQLDGLDSFSIAAERLGKYISVSGSEFQVGDRMFTPDDSLLYTLEHRIGAEETARALPQLRARNPHVETFLTAIDTPRQVTKQPRAVRDPAMISYAEIKQAIRTSTRLPVLPWRWAEYASPTDLVQAATDLEVETDPEKLRKYLRIFSKVTFPLDHQILFPLAQNEDEFLAVAAINALQNIAHPSVREFALTMIERSYHSGRMVGLLSRNYQEGDWQFIQSITASQLDKDDYHALGYSVRDVFELHPSQDSTTAFLNVYHRGPCSLCRERFVECLRALEAVPQWLLEECQHDANLDLRQLAKKLSGSPDSI
jgi:hypothetical protein